MCITGKCKYCGDSYHLTDLRKTACNKPECREKVKRRANNYWTRPERICKECGGIIAIGTGRRVFCSEECSAKSKNERCRIREEIKRKKNFNKICIVCGEKIPIGFNRRLCCSPECSDIRKKARDVIRLERLRNQTINHDAIHVQSVMNGVLSL